MDQDTLHGRTKPDPGPTCPFPETQVILDALQPFDPPAKTMPIAVTEADCCRKFFRKWTESMSTSASGKHLGHCKAPLSLGLGQEPPIKPDAITELQLQLKNVALTHGHVCDRWKNIVSVMIEENLDSSFWRSSERSTSLKPIVTECWDSSFGVAWCAAQKSSNTHSTAFGG